MESINWIHITITSVIAIIITFSIGLLIYCVGPKLFPREKTPSRAYKSRSPAIKDKGSTTEYFEGVRTYTKETFYEDAEGNKIATREQFDYE